MKTRTELAAEYLASAEQCERLAAQTLKRYKTCRSYYERQHLQRLYTMYREMYRETIESYHALLRNA